MKLPAIHLYTGDWLRDVVAGCSLAAQGLWLRMMFLMHDSERYGYLVQNGTATPPESIARRCGCTPDQYVTLLAELDDAGVPSRTQDGIIFSRRMTRDAEERAKAANRKRTERNKSDSHADVTGNVTPLSRRSRAPSSMSDSNSTTTPRARRTEVGLDSDHKRLMTELQNRSGPISDGAAQGKAIKWLLEHYDAETCLKCLDSLEAEKWRTNRKSWLTVQKEIGNWLKQQQPKARGMVL